MVKIEKRTNGAKTHWDYR